MNKREMGGEGIEILKNKGVKGKGEREVYTSPAAEATGERSAFEEG